MVYLLVSAKETWCIYFVSTKETWCIYLFLLKKRGVFTLFLLKKHGVFTEFPARETCRALTFPKCWKHDKFPVVGNLM